MNLALVTLLSGMGVALLALALRSLRSHRLAERYVLMFGALSLPFIMLAVWPDAVGEFALYLGIQYHTVLLLAVTAFFLPVTFKLFSIVSVQQRRLTTLAQEVAILRTRLEAGASDLEG